MFATLRRLIGVSVQSFVACSVDDGPSMARLYALHAALTLLLAVVKKAAAASMTPAACGFHAGESAGAVFEESDLTSAPFLTQYVSSMTMPSAASGAV